MFHKPWIEYPVGHHLAAVHQPGFVGRVVRHRGVQGGQGDALGDGRVLLVGPAVQLGDDAWQVRRWHLVVHPGHPQHAVADHGLALLAARMADRALPFGRLDDEGAHLAIELVRVGLEPTMLGLLEREGEGVESLVRAEPDEAAGAQVDVGISREGGFWVLAVRDHGPGIAPEHVPRLTERFYRVDRSRSRDTGGTGLGLAISKGLVELMGGRIDVTSEPGVGSVFTVYLNMAVTSQVNAPTKAKPQVSLRALDVLIVDDHPLNLKLLDKFLVKRGHKVTKANGGIEAVQTSEGQRFDLILMDIDMPEVDGHEASRRIRAGFGKSNQSFICALSGLALGADLIAPGALLNGVLQSEDKQHPHAGAYFGWWQVATKLNRILALNACAQDDAGVDRSVGAEIAHGPAIADAAASATLAALVPPLREAADALARGASVDADPGVA